MNLDLKFIHFDNFKQPMNYSFDFWDVSHSHQSVGSVNLFFQPDSPLEVLPIHHTIPFQATDEPGMGQLTKLNNLQPATEPEYRPEPHEAVQRLNITKMSGNNRAGEQQKWKRRKKTTPSPYHNYQKHLNTTLRQLVVFPSPEDNAPSAVLIAHRLWSVFMQNYSATKKILHFIFNEFNEYRIKEEQLKAFGFEDIYTQCPRPLLAEAKTSLTQLVLEQLVDENVDTYLETRRIKNQTKFKRYLMTFRKELQDGFLKKRFTNRSRKEQMRREIEHDNP